MYIDINFIFISFSFLFITSLYLIYINEETKFANFKSLKYFTILENLLLKKRKKIFRFFLKLFLF